MKPVTDPALLEHLNSGAPPAALGGAPRPVSDPALLAALNAPASGVAGPTQPYRATDDMSLTDRLIAGAGHGASQVFDALGQGAMHAGSALGLVDPRDVQYNDNAVRQDAELYNADLGKTTSGQVGSIAGQIAATLPLSRLRPVAGTGFLPGFANASIQGAIFNALNPVEDVKGPATLADLVAGTAPQGEDYLQAKLGQGIVGSAFGGGSHAVASGAAKVLETMLAPTNIAKTAINQFLARANASPHAQEGEALAQRTGVDLTPGQVSGSKAMMTAEQAARQSVHSSDIAFEGDARRLGQLQQYWENLIGRHTARDASAATAGAEIQNASNQLIRGLEDFRGRQAAQDFGAVRALTANAQEPIAFSSTADALAALQAEHGAVGTPASDKIAAFARKQLENVSPKAGGLADADRQVMQQLGVRGFAPADLANISPQAASMMERASPGIGQRIQAEAIPAAAPAEGNLDKLMRLRSHLSKVASGNASIGGDREDRMIARQLLGTIDQDIENSAAQVGGDLGGALRQANARYREVSQQIEGVRSGPLGKILGQDVAGAFQSGNFNTVAPETVMQRLGALKPSEITVVRGMLEHDQPQAWQAFKAHMLQDALEKAQAQAPSSGANALPLQPNVLINALAKTPAQVARLRAVFDPAEMEGIQHGLDVARRLSDRTGYNFSGTAGQAEVLDFLNNPLGAAKGLGNLGASKVAQLLTKGAGARQVAQVMTDANGRAALLQLERLPPGSAEATKAIAQIAAILGLHEKNGPSNGKQDGQ